MKQELALDPGENRIEVIAYEGRNLLASLPARTTIAYDGPADTVKPKLHILAIGINDYQDMGWAPPGSGRILAFPPLTASVPDAKAFTAEMEKAGAGQYAEVRVTQALDADATAAKLDETLSEDRPRNRPARHFRVLRRSARLHRWRQLLHDPPGLSGRARAPRRSRPAPSARIAYRTGSPTASRRRGR